jgi:hypothetical protein
MQTAWELKEKGVKRTKVTRDDGHAFVTLESPALARKIFPPEDGFTVTEVYGYDADLDGPPRPFDTMHDLLSKLSQKQLETLVDTLHRGWVRAGEVYPIMSEDFPVPGVDLTRNLNQNPIVYDLEKTHRPVINEYWGRWLGCRWSACAACHHTNCGFCAACNPDGQDNDDE